MALDWLWWRALRHRPSLCVAGVALVWLAALLCVECVGSHFSRCAVAVIFDPGTGRGHLLYHRHSNFLLLVQFSSACFTLVCWVCWQPFLMVCCFCALRSRHGHVHLLYYRHSNFLLPCSHNIASGGRSCYVAKTGIPTPWAEVNANSRSWHHAQCGQAVRADRHESGRSAAGAWRTQKVASFKQSQNELRRGTWQVRQVRHQQHAWTTKRCSDSWLAGQLAQQEFPARQSVSMAASADKSNMFNRHAPREHLPYLYTVAKKPLYLKTYPQHLYIQHFTQSTFLHHTFTHTNLSQTTLSHAILWHTLAHATLVHATHSCPIPPFHPQHFHTRLFPTHHFYTPRLCTHTGMPVTFRWRIRVANWAVKMTGFSSSSVCLFFCLILTSLKKGCCTSWKRLRWDQVRSNTRKDTLHVLTCIAKSSSRSGTRTSAADLIYLNSLTATAWLTVANEQVRQKGVPFWCHRSKQASLLVPDLQWSLAPPAARKLKRSQLKSLRGNSGSISEVFIFRTSPRETRCAKSYASPRSSSSSHDLHHMYTCWIRMYYWKLIPFLGNARPWNANRHGQNMCLWEHHSLWYFRRLVCWLPSCKFYCLF